MNRRLLVCSCLSFLSPALVAQTRPLPAAANAIKVRLKDYKGGPVQDATVQIVAVTKGTARVRPVSGQQPVVLAPKDFAGDFARLADLPAGEFALLVENPLHAKTLSKPFTIPATDETEVVVTLAAGTRLEGTVVGPDKKPVAGALVRTMTGDAARPDSIMGVFAALFVDTLTIASTKTGADGTFRLDHVAAGKYRIVAGHDDFAPVEVDAEIDGAATKKLEAIRLQEGALVSGRVVRDGKGVAGADVRFQFEDVSAIKDPMQGMRVKVYAAKTDDEGNFRLSARVPFGKGYVLMAAEPGQPLDQAMQFGKSKRVFEVVSGSREHTELLQLK